MFCLLLYPIAFILKMIKNIIAIAAVAIFAGCSDNTTTTVAPVVAVAEPVKSTLAEEPLKTADVTAEETADIAV